MKLLYLFAGFLLGEVLFRIFGLGMSFVIVGLAVLVFIIHIVLTLRKEKRNANI